MSSPPYPFVQFLQARHYKPANRNTVDLVVIHSAEIGKSLDGAEALMRGFARKRLNAAGAEIVSSAHYNVDADSVTQSVRDEDIAYHAPGANSNGIGIELCGRARQTAEEWDDPFSRAMLDLAARLTADRCTRWSIPTSFVNADGLLRGDRGITTHAEVSRAYRKSTHFDPGPAFPLQRFVDQVRVYAGRVVA